MADSEIPNKFPHAVRQTFWNVLLFVFILIGVERYFDPHGSTFQVGACVSLAILCFLLAVYWDRLLPNRWRTEADSHLGYLRDEDSELGSAIRDMAWQSAWGKWYAAQCLASGHINNQDHVMQIAVSVVLQELTDGHLNVRGRLPGQLNYEQIPETHWRSTALHMIKDDIAIWKLILVPRGGAEIRPDGTVVGRHQDSIHRTAQLSAYDSLIVSSRQFEKIWPRRDRHADAARKSFLKKAKKAGANQAEIERLSRS